MRAENERHDHGVAGGRRRPGILLASHILAATAAAAGFDVKVSEVKGMSQRGGSVLSTVRFGQRVWSPVFGRADVVIATELLEARRGLDLLVPRGALICAATTRIPRALCCAGRKSTPTISRRPRPLAGSA